MLLIFAFCILKVLIHILETDKVYHTKFLICSDFDQAKTVVDSLGISIELHL